MITDLVNDLQKVASPAKAESLNRYFKTEVGGYGEGDIFIGVTVPDQRKIAYKYLDLTLEDIQKLLESDIHEHRLTAIMILYMKYGKTKNLAEKEEIYNFYLKNTKYINNWDLIDGSSNKIVGNFLLDKDRSILTRLGQSENIWERRIAIIATYEFIRNKQFDDTIRIAEILVNDKHDLIQKAVGWMLREMGKRDIKPLEEFLEKYHKSMPRTMLRYAIEKFDQKKKDYYMGRKS